MSVSLGGNICIRNGTLLDYPWMRAVRSLLPICDKVIICDCDSTDGTRELIDLFAATEKKVIPLNYPWTNPVNDNQWWPNWINYARQHLPTDMHIQLDADEILHEDDYPLIRQLTNQSRPLFFHRLNFWRDHKHLIPEGYCCGTKVLKLARTEQPIPSDYPYAPANDTVSQATECNVRVFHYGFLRKREAFFRKAREVQRIWAGSFDPRLEAAEKVEGNWMENPGVTGWEDRVVPWDGTHPQIMKEWLKDRGYDC